MSNLIEFKNDQKTYHKIAKQRFKTNDISGALNAYRFAYGLNQNNAEIILEIADLYYYIGCFEEALDYYFKVISLKGREAYPFVLFEISKCYFKTGKYYLSEVYYFDFLEIAEKAELEMETDDFTYYEFVSQFYDQVPEIKISDIENDKTVGKLINRFSDEEMIEFMRAGYNKDINLSGIELCKLKIGEILLRHKDYKKAKAVFEDLFKAQKNDATIVSNIIFCNRKLNQNENNEYYYRFILKNEFFEINDKITAMLTLYSGGYHGEAFGFNKKLLKEEPYNIRLLQAYAVSCNNSGDFSESLASLKKIQSIDADNYLNGVFIKIAEDNLNNNENQALPYEYEDIGKLGCFKKLNKLAAKLDKKISVKELGTVRDNIVYYLQNPEIDFLHVCFTLMNEKMLDVNSFDKMLLSVKSGSVAIKNIILVNIFSMAEKNVNAVVDGFFKTLEFKKLNFDYNENFLILNAYADCFCLLSEIDSNFTDSLIKGVYHVKDFINDNVNLFEAPGLASALILKHAKIYEISNLTHFLTLMFDVDENKFKNVCRLFNKYKKMTTDK